MTTTTKPATKRAKPKITEPEWAYLLRTCQPGGTSRNGEFQWDLTPGALTTAPDWDPADRCGGGLHGLLNGEGKGGLLSFDLDAVWMIVRCHADLVVVVTDQGGGKVKVPWAETVATGTREEVTAHLTILCPGRSIVGGTSTSGDRGTSTSGDGGTSTSGDGGTSTSGDRGTSTSGYRGTSTSGYRGTVAIRWWDSKANRYRMRYADTGAADGDLKPNQPYRLNEVGEFVEATA